MSKRAKRSAEEVESTNEPEIDDSKFPFYVCNGLTQACPDVIPEKGHPAQHVLREIQDNHKLDFSEFLNTSSYVNVVSEKEELDVVKMGLRVNIADQTVYPQSFKMHNWCVNMVAKLWNCPVPDDLDEYDGAYPGAGTVGSTEACLLSGLALKFRWREWYKKKHNLSDAEIVGVRPNLVMSNLFQAAWEKLFKYMDVEYKFVGQTLDQFKLDPKKIAETVDDKTMGIVCIMGNHYGGQYDPVQEVDEVLTKINKERGFQIGIHVDGASGGFVAPFQRNLKPWDFRLPNVLSISASGHKFGESCCGTGWVIWRQRKDLSEHVAISVSYLGGNADSYTLNFSRPASGIYNQYYKFLRLGVEGYTLKVNRMMEVAAYIRAELEKVCVNKGKTKLFKILDDGDSGCLPVVTAMLDPKAKRPYDDIDLQWALSQHHWYVSGYHMNLEDPLTKEKMPLFTDMPKEASMFRVVVKSNLTMSLARNLVASFHEAVHFLEEHGSGYVKIHKKAKHHSGHKAC